MNKKNRWLEEYIDKELNENTVEKKYYEFGIPVVYDTKELRDLE